MKRLLEKIVNWTTYAEYYSYPSGAKGWRRKLRVLRLFHVAIKKQAAR